MLLIVDGFLALVAGIKIKLTSLGVLADTAVILISNRGLCFHVDVQDLCNAYIGNKF